MNIGIVSDDCWPKNKQDDTLERFSEKKIILYYKLLALDWFSFFLSFLLYCFTFFLSFLLFKVAALNWGSHFKDHLSIRAITIMAKRPIKDRQQILIFPQEWIRRVCLFVCLFICSFVCLFVHLFVCLFVPLFVFAFDFSR